MFGLEEYQKKAEEYVKLFLSKLDKIVGLLEAIEKKLGE